MADFQETMSYLEQSNNKLLLKKNLKEVIYFKALVTHNVVILQEMKFFRIKVFT